jgi:hypothetical protein
LFFYPVVHKPFEICERRPSKAKYQYNLPTKSFNDKERLEMIQDQKDQKERERAQARNEEQAELAESEELSGKKNYM